MKRLIIMFAAATMLITPAIASAQTAQGSGKAPDVIIKVNTPEGPKWYRLGEQVEILDVTKGEVKNFSYANETVDATKVTPEGKPEKSDQ